MKPFKTVMNLDRISVIKVNDGYEHLVMLAAHLVTSLINIVRGRCKRTTLASQIKSLAGFMVLDITMFGMPLTVKQINNADYYQPNEVNKIFICDFPKQEHVCNTSEPPV